MRTPVLSRSFVLRGLAALALAAAFAAPLAAVAAEESPVTIAAANGMRTGDFAALEKQYALLKRPGRIEANGVSPLGWFDRGIDMVIAATVKDDEAYLRELEALTLEWARDNPKSALAHILHAAVLVEHGWSYRGGGYAKEVPPEAWKDFHDYLRRAVSYLEAHADVALADSGAHRLLLKIGRGLDWNIAQLDAIRREGLKRNPDDIDLYFAMVEGLLPKWGGTPKQLDDYIRQATAETRDRFGTGMYARLYATAADRYFKHSLFESSHADWDTMKQAYEDMFARYPDSPERRNDYAYMACLARDKDTLLRLLDEIGTDIRLSEWGANPERTLEGCRRWAGKL